MALASSPCFLTKRSMDLRWKPLSLAARDMLPSQRLSSWFKSALKSLQQLLFGVLEREVFVERNRLSPPDGAGAEANNSRCLRSAKVRMWLTTFISSTTLPGQWSSCSARTAPGDKRLWPCRCTFSASLNTLLTIKGMSSRRCLSGGQLNVDDREAKIEVFSEIGGLNFLDQISVSSRNHPHIDWNDIAAAHPPHLAVLQHAQQFRLQIDSALPQLVQENRSPLARSKAPPRIDRSRERTLLVAKQLATR